MQQLRHLIPVHPEALLPPRRRANIGALASGRKGLKAAEDNDYLPQKQNPKLIGPFAPIDSVLLRHANAPERGAKICTSFDRIGRERNHHFS